MRNCGERTKKEGISIGSPPTCVWRRRDHTLSFSIFYFGKPPPTSSTSAPPSLCHPRRRPHPSRVVAQNGAASGMSSLVDQAALVLPLGLAYAMMVVAQVSGPQIVGMLHGAAAQAEASPPEDVAPGTPLLECVVAPRAARAPPECPLVQLSWSHPCLTAPCWTSPCLTAAAAASLPTQTLGHASPFLARMCVALTDRACVVSAGCARATQTTTSTRSPTLCTRRV